MKRTDDLEPHWNDDDPPPQGFDVCGRRILDKFEDQQAFEIAMRNYRKRTGLYLGVPKWSFIERDLAGTGLHDFWHNGNVG